MRPTDFSDVEALKEQLKAHPNDVRAKGLYALALMQGARSGEEAQKLIDDGRRVKPPTSAARGADPGRRRSWRCCARTARRRKMLLDGLIADRRRRLRRALRPGQDRRGESDVAEAEKQLDAGQEVGSRSRRAYVELAKLCSKTREDDALQELEAGGAARLHGRVDPQAAVEKLRGAGSAGPRWCELAPLALLHRSRSTPTCTPRWRARCVELGRSDEALARDRRRRWQCEPDEKRRASCTQLELSAGRI